MKKSKKLWITGAVLAAALFSIANVIGLFKPDKITVTSMCSYAEEAQDPKWIGKTSELIIVGDMVKKKSPEVGKDAVNYRDAVYVDNQVQITQLIKNNTTEKFNVGDIITIRTLGGKTDKLDYRVDTEGLLPEKGKLLLCLVNISKMPELPQINSEQCYAVVGRIHGAFNLDSNGLAMRKIVNDSFNVNQLIKLLNE